MKITPMGSERPVIQPASSVGAPDKIERIKAKLAGTPIAVSPSDTPTEKTVAEQVRENRQASSNAPKKITMKTKSTIYRDIPDDLLSAVDAVSPEAAAPVEGAGTSDTPVISANSEQTSAAIEETKPLSPQFAALAKQKRALQVKESALLAREEALKSGSLVTNDSLIARIKAEPLSVLLENGVTYDQLTEAILSNNTPNNPQISKLEAEIKALKEGLENQSKSLTEKDQAAEQQVLAQMRKQADQLIATGDAYEMVRETGSQAEVIELIKRTFYEKGELLDVTDALDLVETHLINEAEKIAKIKKVQSRLTPEPQQTQAPVNQGAKQIKTLTARDGATVPISRKERAMLAALGKLYK